MAIDVSPEIVDAPLRTLTQCWRGQINSVSRDAGKRLGLNAVLIRPDGFVAWATDNASDGEGFLRAAVRWFGEPERSIG